MMESYSQDGTAYAVPSQMFDYAPDSPVHLGGGYYAETDNAGGLEDGNDAKRRRIARACDMCRKKKIKCDGKVPNCSHCENYKTECVFTPVEKKRSPPKGAKYIEGLENRLGRMEALLKLTGLLGEEDDRTDLGTLEKKLADKALSQHNRSSSSTPNKSPGRSESVSQNDGQDSQHEGSQRGRKNSSRSPISSPKPQKPLNGRMETDTKQEGDVEPLSELMCSLVTNDMGETRYIGASSGFSIFSPKGIQWVNDKTGDESFQKMMTEAASGEQRERNSTWKPEIFGDIFTRRSFRHLPPLSETLSLLKDYFENFNCMFPLFHEPTFMHLVYRQYSRDPYEGSGWWASLNCALAIAHRLRVMSNLVSAEDDQKAWGFLKNALGVLAELTMKNTDLLSVQALLGMALFLLGTQNPQPSFLLVAAATRLAHSIGLHKRGTGFNLGPVEVEQRKRVFWIAYLLDKDMCLRSGRPPAQDDDDMNVELPSEDPGDNIGNIPLSGGKSKINLFRLMCTFSVIQGKVYKQLYSTKAAKASDGELLNRIGDLDKELEQWKDSIPVDFRPEHEIKASHTPLILQVVVLHFAYHNCLTTIHRMSVHHGYWTSRLSNYAIQGLNARPINHRVFSSAGICVQAARSTIQLLKYIPQGDYACVWMVIFYPVTALMTLFTSILQNPQDTRARTDIRLMHQVVSFLSALAIDEETGGVKRMLQVCLEFERIAKLVLDKAEKESHSRKKRKNKDDDDVPLTNGDAHSDTASTTVKSQNSSHNTAMSNVTFEVHMSGALFGGPVSPSLANQRPSSTNTNAPSSITAVASNNGANTPLSASSKGGGGVEPPTARLPEYVPEPGSFPSYPLETSGLLDMGQFAGIPGMSSPSMAAAAAASFQPGFAATQDPWQVPILDWASATDWSTIHQEQFAAATAAAADHHHQHHQQHPTVQPANGI